MTVDFIITPLDPETWLEDEKEDRYSDWDICTACSRTESNHYAGPLDTYHVVRDATFPNDDFHEIILCPTCLAAFQALHEALDWPHILNICWALLFLEGYSVERQKGQAKARVEAAKAELKAAKTANVS